MAPVGILAQGRPVGSVFSFALSYGYDSFATRPPGYYAVSGWASTGEVVSTTWDPPIHPEPPPAAAAHPSSPGVGRRGIVFGAISHFLYANCNSSFVFESSTSF